MQQCIGLVVRAVPGDLTRQTTGDFQMRTIYEAHYGRNNVQDFDSEADARKIVEENNSGYVVTFVRGFDGRDRSCAMHKFDGEWKGINIHE
jgi:hypothetical protein